MIVFARVEVTTTVPFVGARPRLDVAVDAISSADADVAVGVTCVSELIVEDCEPLMTTVSMREEVTTTVSPTSVVGDAI